MKNYSISGILRHNLLHSRRSYIGYFTAATLAISTFFAFSFFLFHPSLTHILQNGASSTIVQLLVIGQIGIAIFSIFFIIFFHRFIIRLRGKEIGLLSTLGVTTKQLGRMLYIETTIIAILALILGMLLGFIEACVMFYVLTPLVTSTFTSILSIWPILYGVLFFSIVFSIDGLLAARGLKKMTPSSMLQASRVTQFNDSISIKKLILGIVLLTIGYLIALMKVSGDNGASSVNMLPVIIFVSLGTYIIFEQGLSAGFNYVRDRTFSGLSLISSSRLAYRARDFAKISTLICLLNSAVLALLGVALGVLTHVRQIANSPTELNLLLQVVSVFLFVCFFLAVLFFVATLTIFYVKLFTQASEDIHQFKTLNKIGLTKREQNRILSIELALLFFIPNILAVIHSTVAMNVFTNKIAPGSLNETPTWQLFGITLCIFFFTMLCFYLFARRQYNKIILSALR